MINHDEIKRLIETIKQEIKLKNPMLLVSFPVDAYMKALNTAPSIANYSCQSKEIHNFCNAIVASSDKGTLELYHKLVLLYLIIGSNAALSKGRFSDDIKYFFEINFNRVVKTIKDDSNRTNFYTYSNDKFCKDIAVCSMRLIPTGARKINLNGISRKFLFVGGFSSFVKRIYFIATLGGFKPLYEMHTDSHDSDLMAEFNPEGFIRSYKKIAGLLKENPRIKGVFASSWFYDPRIAIVSPRLAYLREIITSNGGKVFFMGNNLEATKDALFKSPTRRKLFEEKKYVPHIYMIVWPRKALLSWADKT